jgi:hypothetical protein
MPSNSHAGWAPVLRSLSAHAAAAAAKLRNLAPYAAMELILPGGSLMALLFWLYRRQKMRRAGVDHSQVLDAA